MGTQYEKLEQIQETASKLSKLSSTKEEKWVFDSVSKKAKDIKLSLSIEAAESNSDEGVMIL